MTNTSLIDELVEALEQVREKLQIECGGLREYKGGVPSQVLFPRIDELLKRAKARRKDKPLHELMREPMTNFNRMKP